MRRYFTVLSNSYRGYRLLVTAAGADARLASGSVHVQVRADVRRRQCLCVDNQHHRHRARPLPGLYHPTTATVSHRTRPDPWPTLGRRSRVVASLSTDFLLLQINLFLHEFMSYSAQMRPIATDVWAA